MASGMRVRRSGRLTVAVVLTIALSFSAARPERYSRTKRRSTLTATITEITTVAFRSPVRNEMMANASNSRMKGFLKASSNWMNHRGGRS